MQYFKNTELAKLHSVSEGTVRRWIDATRAGRLDLQLYQHGGKWHIANTAKNMRLIDELLVRGKKRANARWHRNVSPTTDFYRLYSKGQIADIIANIDIHREVPLQYDYFGEGAGWWDAYAHKLWAESEDNMLTAAVELLRTNFENLRRAVVPYERVNVVDLCIGNALPVKELLTQLNYDESLLHRYIGIDISPAMLEVAERNLKEWFDGHVQFEGHVRDITHERFGDLLINEKSDTLNLVTLLGGTLQNFRSQDDVLKAIYNSMSRQDVLVTSTKLDSPESRRYFDAVVEPELPRLILGLEHELALLGVDPSLYDVEQDYDPDQHMRYSRIRLKLDLTIKFDLGDTERCVELKKGESILLWRYWHLTALEYLNLLHRNGFALLGSSLTNDEQFLLTISRIAQTQC